MSAENEVRHASRQFYAGLSRMADGDAGPLADIWSHSTTVTTMHRAGGREVGWEAVRGSFEQMAQLSSDGEVGLKDQLIQVAADVAYELGIEQGQFKIAGNQVTIEHRVTNIYQRVAEVWEIVHRHTDISPAMLDVLSVLPPPSAKSGG